MPSRLRPLPLPDRASPHIAGMPYRSVDIYFMSGTGNTFRASRVFAETAASPGCDVSMTPMGKSSRPRSISGGSSKLVLLASPTHGFTAPWLAIWFAMRMPRGGGAHAAVLVTRAGSRIGRVILPGLDGTAAYILALIMLLKGYRVRGAIGIDMPSNWLAVHPGFKRASAEAIIAHSRPSLDRYCRRILSGRMFFGSWISFPLGLLLLPVSLGYLVYGRAMFGKLFFAGNKCNGCGLCAKQCQHNAIRMRGRPLRPYWTFRCESCMRCMAYCPKETIEVSHSFAVLAGMAMSVYPPLLAALLFSMVPGSEKAPLGRLAFQASVYAFWLGVLMLMYVFFWMVTRNTAVNRIFKYTTLTTLFRRYHEPETRVGDMLVRREWPGRPGKS